MSKNKERRIRHKFLLVQIEALDNQLKYLEEQKKKVLQDIKNLKKVNGKI